MNRQKAHYEAIHDVYSKHYYDEYSMSYRREFLLKPLLEGYDLNGFDVADLACGNGSNSLILKDIFPDVKTVGFDISSKACTEYRGLVGEDAKQVDLTVPFVSDDLFDFALVIGGLHHCVKDLFATMQNIANMLKPGGFLFLIEPNSRFVFEVVRKVWYRFDKYFDSDTEHALNHDVLAEISKDFFIPTELRYLGGPAYFLVLNSLILRVPVSMKAQLAGFVTTLEKAYNTLPGNVLFPCFSASWRKM